jgi:flagellar motor switch protein FliN/FliY
MADIDVEEAETTAAVAAKKEAAVRNYRLLADVPIRLSVQVGSTSMKLCDLLDITEGSVVQLDRQAHELLDIMANGTLIARGEVVTVNGRFGIRVIDVINTDPSIAGLERRG